MKINFFFKKLLEDVRDNGGVLSIGEFRMLVGRKYKVKKIEFPDLLRELEKGGIFHIGRRKIRVK